jgi:hypothetical protein
MTVESNKFFYNRQVTHNSHFYENQDFHVLKITNLLKLTFDNWNFWSEPTVIFFFDLTVLDCQKILQITFPLSTSISVHLEIGTTASSIN